jgi:hypothetical protein
VVTGNATALGESKVLALKRIRIQDATMQGAVTRQATGGRGEEYLLLLGDAVAELFPDHRAHPSVVRGVPAEVVERWSPRPLAPGFFFAGVGVTTASLVASIVFWSMAKEAESEYQALAKKGVTEPIRGAELVALGDQAESRARMANIGLGVTAALAVTTALVYTFVDWGSDAEIMPMLAPLPRSGAAGGVAATF